MVIGSVFLTVYLADKWAVVQEQEKKETEIVTVAFIFVDEHST